MSVKEHYENGKRPDCGLEIPDRFQTLLDEHPWQKLSRWRKWLSVLRHCHPWAVMRLMESYHKLVRFRWKYLRDHPDESGW